MGSLFEIKGLPVNKSRPGTAKWIRITPTSAYYYGRDRHECTSEEWSAQPQPEHRKAVEPKRRNAKRGYRVRRHALSVRRNPSESTSTYRDP